MFTIEEIRDDNPRTFKSTGAIAAETSVLPDDGSWAIRLTGHYTYDELIALAQDLKMINESTRYRDKGAAYRQS
jgi:hypothetical protein